MLPEPMQSLPVPAALEAWDPHAILNASLDLGETLLWISPGKIVSVCKELRDNQGFERICGVSAIDRYPLEPRFEVVYFVHSVSRNIRLKLKVALPGTAPAVESVTCVWEGANWYEREAFDLFGIRFEGHPNLKRIMMPEGWEGHPLRRDFPTHGHKAC